jgi:osmotically-inducible protein OsmY
MKSPVELLRLGAAITTLAILLGGCSKPPESVVTTPPASNPGNNTADGDVTSNVKTALLQDATLKGFDINVVTLKGDVRLIGVLDGQSQIDAAVRIARGADGVHSIHDELTIRK